MTHIANAAAEKLISALPVPTALTAAAIPELPAVAATTPSVNATLIGAPTAQLSVTLIDQDALHLAADGGTVTVADLLQPALDAAASAVGAGSLAVESGAPLSGSGVTHFELTDASGATAGWFSIAVGKTVSPVADQTVVERIARINDVEVQLTVVIGKTRRTVRDVLGLEPGAVVELDRSAGDPADVLVNGKLVAHGEVVVVDQDYAVRITRILDARTQS